MKIKSLHINFQMPTKATSGAGGFDIYMPEAGSLYPQSTASFYNLGFSAEVPKGYVALILPRSGAGAKRGVSLNNTVGVIDSDYRGEWIVAMRNRNKLPIHWKKGDSLFQFILVPVLDVDLELVEELSDTDRGDGGFGSTDPK